MALIEIENLYAGYSDKLVLKNINLKIEENEFVGIYGPNGSGKTTLFLSILGLTKYFLGRIKIFGEAVNKWEFLNNNKKIGYVPQNIEIDPKMPVLTIDVLSSAFYGKKRFFERINEEEKEKLKEIGKLLRIEDLFLKPFGHLSGGQRQKVLIGRALLAGEKILLLDEPFSFLDEKSKQEIVSIIKNFYNEKKLTVLLICHEKEILDFLTNRTVEFENGTIKL